MPIHAATPDAAVALAQAIIARAGIHVTVCEMPRAGDGTLAAAMAQQGIAQVHALALDNKAVDAARGPSVAAGLLGTKVIIETGAPTTLPLGNWVADLYVVADATDKNLPALSATEAARVLSPYRGVAVVGNPAGGKAKLTKAALSAWAKGTGGEATTSEDAGGLWAVVKMPALKGGDDWSHYNHNADGNPVSNDTTIIAGRFNMQWHAKPIWAGKFDTYVAAGGRLFGAHGAIYWRSWTGRVPYELETRDLYNGQVLWRRPIPSNFGNIGSLLVATPDCLYLADNDGVLLLNPESGAVIRRLVVTDPARQCRWLLLADGVLLTVNGPKQANDATGNNDQATMQHEQDADIQNNMCQQVVAWNTVDGTELWRQSEERLDPSKLVISGQHVYYHANMAYAVCLDLHSGKTLWKTPDPIAEPKSPGMALAWHLNEIYTPRQGAIATPDAYLINSFAHRQCQTFAGADGKLLWTHMDGKPSDDPKVTTARLNLLTNPLILGSTIVARTEWTGRTAFDLMSGKQIDANNYGNFTYGGCGHFTADANGLLIGQQGSIFDSRRSHYLLNEFSKAACGVSQFIADGVVVKVPSDCSGCYEWRGYFAVTPQANISTPPPARLEQGPGGAPDTVLATEQDWPTYRAREDRRASSSAVLADAGAIRWTYTPHRADAAFSVKDAVYLGSDRQAAPPIAVGERIWLGTAEGAVVCLDRATGAEKWRYWTGGRIMSSPTWSAGRVYVGSGDGRVYCLDAATGALVWRYRVSSAERRVMITGMLSSAWPVMASPLLHDGVVYAAAGYVSQLDGARLCALDAGTGALRWEQQFDMPSAADDLLMISRSGGGQNFSVKNAIDTTAPNAAPQAVYQSFRLGNSPTSYTISGLPATSGCTVRLHFMEPWENQAGKRVMDISINGQVALTGIDPFALAGAQNKAVVREANATTDADGKLTITFAHSQGVTNQIIASGFEVLIAGKAMLKAQMGGAGGNGFQPDQEFRNRPPADPPTAGGQLAWDQGRLYWKAGDWGVALLDPTTGKIVKRGGAGRGQDVGILPGGWVASGGRQFILPPEELWQNGCNCIFLQTDAQGFPTKNFFSLTNAHVSDGLPAWDDDELLLSGAPGNNFTLSHGFTAALTACLAAPTYKAPGGGGTGNINYNWISYCAFDLPADGKHPVLPESYVKNPWNKAMTPLLAKNAVVCLAGNDAGSPWLLYVVSRTERKFLWQVHLPAMPSLGGMALTHAGDVLIPLIDGRVVCVGTKE